MTTVHIAGYPNGSEQRCIRCCRPIVHVKASHQKPGAFVAEQNGKLIPMERDALVRGERPCRSKRIDTAKP